LHSAVPSATSGRSRATLSIDRANEEVEVLWVNYEGMGEKYGSLRHGFEQLFTTFVSHPWFASPCESLGCGPHLWLASIALEAKYCRAVATVGPMCT
jgi:hypothetical protein